MKFAFLPKPWDEAVADLEAAGHEHVSIDDNPDMLLFRGTPHDFPDTLPGSVKVVQHAFAGVDNMREIIAAHDVRWANAGGLYDDTVAESAVGLLLAAMHRHQAVKPSWNQRELAKETDFLFDGKRLALIGAGGIGKKLIEFLAPFGVEVTAVNRSGNPVEGAARTVKMLDADRVWEDHDIFVLLTPLTDETRHMVNAETLGMMKPGAYVVNVGRGPLIDTDALVEALSSGAIAGAALDVTDPEPLPEDHPLWEMDNCVITPHTANVPRFMARRIGKLAAENWERFAAGEEMKTEVDADAGY